MSLTLETVAIHHPDDHAVRMIINADELCDGHVVWDEPVDLQPADEVEQIVGDIMDRRMDTSDVRAFDIDETVPLGAPQVADIQPSEPPRVTKGPRGKWYVKRGKETLAGPFETEGEAHDRVVADGG